ncbi:phage tail protein [Paenibacillus hamazuiensis]|uniref:phage tail protein n=1 Tax=Paenibacillus hamazuiensis TaxID=2936508 RepID=UPI00200D0EAA|nr:phage tail protein [Paenibacillus hamazuiensis]
MAARNLFFSFNKKSDWAKGRTVNMEIDDQGMRIEREMTYTFRRHVALPDPAVYGAATDLAVGRHGMLYVLTGSAAIYQFDAAGEAVEPLFVQGHGLFTSRAMLAASDRFLFVADIGAPERLAAYSALNGQIVWSMNRIRGMELYPLATAADMADRLYAVVPERVEPGTDGGLVVPQGTGIGFIVLEGDRPRDAPDIHFFTTVERDTALNRLGESFYAAVTPEGELFVYDSGTGRLFRADVTRGDPVHTGPLELPPSMRPESLSGFVVGADGRLYLGESQSIGPDEDGRFIRMLAPDGNDSALIAPLPGRIDKLLIDRYHRMFAFNRQENILTLLELSWRTKPLRPGITKGVYYSHALDSTVEGTEWHKVQLEADNPIETQIRIIYYATDEEMTPDDWVRLSDTDEIAASASGPAIVNPRDALLFGAKGRYLWLKIELSGNEGQNPLLRRLRVYFPRQSLLDYLPAVYQEHEASRQFLDRFLSLFATFFDELEYQIDRMAANFDAGAASGDFVKWIGTWIGISGEQHWTDSQLRRFIRRSPELYRRRGTRSGLESMLEIFIGEKPIIIEHFQLKSMREHAELKPIAERLYGGHPYCFHVLLKPEHADSESKRYVVERILQDHKPAFTEAKLIVLEPWMYLGMHTYLGVNTALSEPSPMGLLPGATMPHHTLLSEKDRDPRLDMHARIEMDAELE